MVAQVRAALRARGRGSEAIQEAALARRLRAQFPAMHGGSYQAFQAVARRAVLAERTARQMNRAYTQTPTAREHAVDPSLQWYNARFKYTVVFSAPSPGGGMRNVMVEHYSDTPMSAREIRRAIIARTDFSDYPRPQRGRLIAGHVATLQERDIQIAGAFKR